MKTQTKLKAVLWIAGIITIVIMAITACSMEGEPGKDGISGKKGPAGADGTDGKNASITLWLFRSGNPLTDKLFPVIIEDQSRKLTSAQIDIIQDALKDFSSSTFYEDELKKVTSGANSNIRFIIQDVPEYTTDKSKEEIQNYLVLDERTVCLRYERVTEVTKSGTTTIYRARVLVRVALRDGLGKYVAP